MWGSSRAYPLSSGGTGTPAKYLKGPRESVSSHEGQKPHIVDGETGKVKVEKWRM